MSKKEFVIEKLNVVKAKEVEGIYEMTEDQFYQLDAELGNEGFSYKICKNKKDPSLKAIYDESKKTKYASIKIVAKPAKTKKSSSKKHSDEIISSKPKFEIYTIVIKETGKKEKTIDSINNCEDIKEFLKVASRKNTEYLHIFKHGDVPTRKSAWIN